MKIIYVCLILVLMAASGYGCTAVAVGAGAVGGYAVGTDERKVGEQIDDAGITTKINAKFAADSTVKMWKIDVDTYRGAVTLNGIVGSQAEIDRAVAISKSVSGVKSVKSNLTIKK